MSLCFRLIMLIISAPTLSEGRAQADNEPHLSEQTTHNSRLLQAKEGMRRRSLRYIYL
ncbi:hypothetical protein PR003_g23245 [Phytophthora rubi]|uniref:RxLR effector protein n=1 Tax=Phytophthora rubi TaxID=129364 RepID=A0A6A4CYA4_9STRA|nr:hypothetical protein PR002_g22510 [Phytophthora rubi]KAE8988745.1 hypothetical protein PR001_g21959 [Phytophthora rubi]KAE9298421.1 hypothetical protein PR003_g23245 [Phytophthora rubi]